VVTAWKNRKSHLVSLQDRERHDYRNNATAAVPAVSSRFGGFAAALSLAQRHHDEAQAAREAAAAEAADVRQPAREGTSGCSCAPNREF
jgi:hypothetical protein